MPVWNLWHGCRKISEGCRNCYVYRIDAGFDRDASQVRKTGDFQLPVKRDRRGAYKVASGETLYTCFSSDFFLDEADEWREDAWQMMRMRHDLNFFIITKRIERFLSCVPSDWGEGWEHVTIGVTCENQAMADRRLRVFDSLPVRHKYIICEPLLGPVDISRWLNRSVESVVAGGESGGEARPCHYDWVLALRDQCRVAGVAFHFKQTGAKFVKDGRLWTIPRRKQHSQAARAGIDLPVRL
ncbi:MAG TPA: DUF5131 family protein [Bacteroidales bacterium]|nr:DUF5131 family protein [Bacteroidales bacterium]